MFELKNKVITFGIYSTEFIPSNGIPTFGVDINYINYFSKFGDIEIIHPFIPIEKYMERIDILVVPGGLDVDPSRYKEKPGSHTSNPNVYFEYYDKDFLKPWLDLKLPVLAICRGFQSLNVSLGGSLYQHIRGHIQKKSGDNAEEDMYTDINGFRVTKTNTFHHQCIKELAPELEMIGWSTLTSADAKQFTEKKWKHFNHRWELDNNKKNLVKSKDNYYVVPELVKGKTLPILGAQYHPEKNDCPLFTKLVNEFIKENFNIESEDAKTIEKTASK